MRNAPHGLMYLNTQPRIGYLREIMGPLGSGPLLEEVRHWRWDSKVYSVMPLPAPLFLCVDETVISQCPAPAVILSLTVAITLRQINPFFLGLLCSYFITETEEK